MQTHQGFILQPTYRIEAGRPVIHLWGKLEGGESFLVRDRRLVPHFWIKASDTERARQLGAGPLSPTDKVTLSGRDPVVRVEVPTPPDTPALRDRLQRQGIVCYEADVRFAMRYLIDRGVRGSLAIRGPSKKARGVDRVYEDPEISASDWTPELSVLSIDIETDPRGSRILSLALHGRDIAEVLLVDPSGRQEPGYITPVDSEVGLLETFGRRVKEHDPDVLTGWNVVDFDFAVLLRRAEQLKVSLELGRGPGSARVRPGRGGWEASQVPLSGRVVLDGIQLLRGAFIRMEEYSLDFVAREVLGEGKILAGPDRAAEILRWSREEPRRLAEYNLADARLVTEILTKLQLVELAVARSRLTGMPPDRVAASIAAFDFLYLSALGPKGVVAPSVGSAETGGPATGGGHVLTPEPGLYENVLILDYKSLYPSLIRTFQIDPLGYVEPSAVDSREDLIVAPNRAAFRRAIGILTTLLDQLFPQREAAKKAGDRTASYAIKILMNSFYGVLGTPVCRFYNPQIANAITSFGRELLLWSKARIETSGLRVLYGDTDSLFVESGLKDPDEALRLGADLVRELNRDVAEHIRATWRVESRLELELDSLYFRLVLPPVRHGSEGARKRYAGLVDREGDKKVVLTGLEAVRSDWTDLARRAQRELYERLFFDRPVEEYLANTVRDLREGKLDDLLVYHKALRKDPDAYTTTTPPHVAAARKMTKPHGRRIAYVITTGGPEPAEERQSPHDYEHYVDKQLRPVAEPILALLDLDFAKVIGDDTQMGLF